MTLLGREFLFPFVACSRVDVTLGQYGAYPADVDLEVLSSEGKVVFNRQFMDLPENGTFSTRYDEQADNLSRFVGKGQLGLVSIQGNRTALLSASSLCVGKNMTA